MAISLGVYPIFRHHNIHMFQSDKHIERGSLLSCFGGFFFSNLPGWPLWGHMDCLRGSGLCGLCGLGASSQGTYNKVAPNTPNTRGGNLVDKVVKWPISLSCGYNLHTMDWSNHVQCGPEQRGQWLENESRTCFGKSLNQILFRPDRCWTMLFSPGNDSWVGEHKYNN